MRGCFGQNGGKEKKKISSKTTYNSDTSNWPIIENGGGRYIYQGTKCYRLICSSIASCNLQSHNFTLFFYSNELFSFRAIIQK